MRNDVRLLSQGLWRSTGCWKSEGLVVFIAACFAEMRIAMRLGINILSVSAVENLGLYIGSAF